MSKKVLFVFILTFLFIQPLAGISLSNVQPSLGIRLSYVGNEDLNGDWSLDVSGSLSTNLTEIEKNKKTTLLCNRLQGKVSINKNGSYKSSIALSITDPHKDQKEEIPYWQKNNTSNIPINFVLSDIKSTSLKQLELARHAEGNIYTSKPPLYYSSASCVPRINHVMDMQISGIYKDGYLKKEIYAIETAQTHKNVITFANLLIFSQINAILDNDPKKLALINKDCTDLKEQTHREKLKQIETYKNNYNQLKPFLSKKEQEEMEYKITCLEEFYGK